MYRSLSFFPTEKQIQKIAPVAQLDRASVCGTEGHRFDSYRVHQLDKLITR